MQFISNLLVLQILINGNSGLLTGAHCQDNGSSASNSVAACEDTFTSGADFVIAHDPGHPFYSLPDREWWNESRGWERCPET